MRYTVSLPTKPYVHHFLCINFGSPADLSVDKELHQEFRRCLSKPNFRYDSKFEPLALYRFSATSEVYISQDDFYRHGWELTRTDVISFGKRLERRAKFLMRNIIAYYSTLMIERDAILRFQQEFGFTEDIWPFESIKKDYYRFGPPAKIHFTAEISEKIEQIILENLSRLGTISHANIKPNANAR